MSNVISAIRLIRSENIGPRSYFTLIQKHGSAKNAVAVLEEIGRETYSQAAAESEVEQAEKAGAKVIIHEDENYPANLASIYDSPPVLFCLGNLELLKRKAVGIVGTRNASANGLVLARNFASQLAQSGVVVVSGLARGIDTEAHKASLSGGTIAVLAGGLDRIYPPENLKLFHEIAHKGLAVSENPFGITAQARHFPQRNRIIAGLSEGVLVVEAARKSGSMITAALARREGRQVFAVPGSPLDSRATGTNYLIKTGAVFAENAQDILKDLHRVEPQPKLWEEELQFLGEVLEKPETLRDRIIAKLSHSPTSVDEVIQQSGATAAHVNEILLELEMAGRITRQYGNKVALAA